jgi:hypothetical protein
LWGVPLFVFTLGALGCLVWTSLPRRGRSLTSVAPLCWIASISVFPAFFSLASSFSQFGPSAMSPVWIASCLGFQAAWSSHTRELAAGVLRLNHRQMLEWRTGRLLLLLIAGGLLFLLPLPLVAGVPAMLVVLESRLLNRTSRRIERLIARCTGE